jgi:23S rRNA-/tRNA-specific pseudouridylate synthase
MIQILAENNFFYVIHKPAGLSVHNQIPSVQQHIKDLKMPEHFVNRLDLETSGLMVIAQKPEYHMPLNLALGQGEKIYRALLRGQMKESSAIWNKPLTDQAEGRKNPQGVSKNRIACSTEFTALRRSKYFTEAELKLNTGRQHQIRKHAALANHAIVGDPRYNDASYNANIFKIYDIQRMFLHAEKISFEYEKENYSFESKDFNLDIFFKMDAPE